MEKTLLILLMGICSLKAQVDSLSSKRLLDPYESRFAKSIAKEIPENLSKHELTKVKKFCKENEMYGAYFLRSIVRNDDDFVNWLKSFDLSHKHWVRFGGAIDSVALFRNKKIENYLFDKLSDEKFKYKNTFLGVFAKNGSLQQCVKLINLYDFENDYENRTIFLKSQVRYKSMKTDSIVNLEFKVGKSLKTLSIFIKYSLKDYNRYDFIPQLKALPKRVAELRTPDNEDYAEDILKELKTLIPYLEQKKKENAPIGLPLDWGMVKETQN